MRRQRAEQALRESEELNRNLVENLPDYVLVYGQGGKILYANPASASALGYSPEELTGTSILSYVTEEYRDRATEKLASRQSGMDIPLYEIEILTRDGEPENRDGERRFHHVPVRPGNSSCTY